MQNAPTQPTRNRWGRSLQQECGGNASKRPMLNGAGSDGMIRHRRRRRWLTTWTCERRTTRRSGPKSWLTEHRRPEVPDWDRQPHNPPQGEQTRPTGRTSLTDTTSHGEASPQDPTQPRSHSQQQQDKPAQREQRPQTHHRNRAGGDKPDPTPQPHKTTTRGGGKEYSIPCSSRWRGATTTDVPTGAAAGCRNASPPQILAVWSVGGDCPQRGQHWRQTTTNKQAKASCGPGRNADEARGNQQATSVWPQPSRSSRGGHPRKSPRTLAATSDSGGASRRPNGHDLATADRLCARMGPAETSVAAGEPRAESSVAVLLRLGLHEGDRASPGGAAALCDLPAGAVGDDGDPSHTKTPHHHQCRRSTTADTGTGRRRPGVQTGAPPALPASSLRR